MNKLYLVLIPGVPGQFVNPIELDLARALAFDNNGIVMELQIILN